ncbi:hypothetical protein FQA47_012585 [Oryzias melastigma]|uniref:Uncharacterized protein n=1 Tax=Oryzias melastigma TaxID=30732 RepID=A0A834FL99_ORYME|nr:hypothetical protein FQA47_012585 [Oryzias melastigma]
MLPQDEGETWIYYYYYYFYFAFALQQVIARQFFKCIYTNLRAAGLSALSPLTAQTSAHGTYARSSGLVRSDLFTSCKRRRSVCTSLALSLSLSLSLTGLSVFCLYTEMQIQAFTQHSLLVLSGPCAAPLIHATSHSSVVASEPRSHPSVQSKDVWRRPIGGKSRCSYRKSTTFTFETSKFSNNQAPQE